MNEIKNKGKSKLILSVIICSLFCFLNVYLFSTSVHAKESMTMDDFLMEGETPADHSDIKEYLDDLKETINEEVEESFGEYDDEATFGGDDTKDATESDDEELAIKRKSGDEITVDIKKLINEKKTDDIDRNDYHLILVNKQNPIPEDYEIHLVSINRSLQADSRIVNDLSDMFDAAAKDGINLWICSAYRSFDRQTQLFNAKIRKYTGNGMNYMDAYALASQSVTVPGTSEHQLGLALDIVTSGHTALDESFGDTAAGKWLAKNATDYGFILRYPKGKENITGIIYEPWHFRYVGKKYSKRITELGLTLEEYVMGDYDLSEIDSDADINN